MKARASVAFALLAGATSVACVFWDMGDWSGRASAGDGGTGGDAIADGAADGAIADAPGDAPIEPTSTGAGTWTKIAPSPLSARDSPGFAWNGTVLFIWGGDPQSLGGGYANDGATYDPATNAWTTLPPVSLSARPGPTALWTGKEFLVWGSSANMDGAAYDPAKNTWRLIPPVPQGFAKRSGETIVWSGTEMLVWQGVGESGPDPGDGAAYDPAKDTWRTMAPSPLSTRSGTSAISDGKVVVFWSGRDNGFVTDGAIYDPAADIAGTGNAWRPLPQPAIDGRVGMSTMLLPPAPGHAHARSGLFGGGSESDDFARGDGIVWDPDQGASGAWTTIGEPSASVLPAAKRLGNYVWYGRQRIWTWGGMENTGPGTWATHGDGASWDVATGTWIAMPTTDAPSPRQYGAFAWTGQSALLWGGSYRVYTDAGPSYTAYADGYRFTPD